MVPWGAARSGACTMCGMKVDLHLSFAICAYWLAVSDKNTVVGLPIFGRSVRACMEVDKHFDPVVVLDDRHSIPRFLHLF